MSFVWLKSYLPRSLYGRAALILILPVVTLQLVVSFVFIQRHFEGVTQQLTREAARGIAYAIRTPEAAEQVARALEFRLQEVPGAEVPEADQRRWYDFTGSVVTEVLHQRLPGLDRVLLPDDTRAEIYAHHQGVFYRVSISRGRLSPSNPHQLLVNMVVFGVVMTVIAYLYLRNQLRPITRLAAAAKAFGRGRTVPYSPSGAVEVRTAGHAFLDMRNRIERQIEQRTLLLTGVSHDLRTPLTRLRLGLSLLEDDDRQPLERDVEEMQHLIDAFLDFARGDAQSGQAEPTDVQALVQMIVDDAQRVGSDVTLAACEGQGEVAVRPASLRRAVENLIQNAVRYGGKAQVSVRLSEQSLRIRVEDDGPGIPPEDRSKALRPFVRLDPARNQDRGTGVGLGLAIAADIARAHGGTIRLGESEALGGLRADIVIAR